MDRGKFVRQSAEALRRLDDLNTDRIVAVNDLVESTDPQQRPTLIRRVLDLTIAVEEAELAATVARDRLYTHLTEKEYVR